MGRLGLAVGVCVCKCSKSDREKLLLQLLELKQGHASGCDEIVPENLGIFSVLDSYKLQQ